MQRHATKEADEEEERLVVSQIGRGARERERKRLVGCLHLSGLCELSKTDYSAETWRLLSAKKSACYSNDPAGPTVLNRLEIC